MGKLVKMKVLIVGMRGLGVETAKNLILAGPQSVSLYDPHPTRLCDLGSNFYCNEEHVKNGVHRSKASQTLSRISGYIVSQFFRPYLESGGKFFLIFSLTKTTKQLPTHQKNFFFENFFTCNSSNEGLYKVFIFTRAINHVAIFSKKVIFC